MGVATEIFGVEVLSVFGVSVVLVVLDLLAAGMYTCCVGRFLALKKSRLRII